MWMVRPDDPLSPPQILDRVAGVRELPVHQGLHVQGPFVEQHVLRTEVAMQQHAAIGALVRARRSSSWSVRPARPTSNRISSGPSSKIS